MRKLILISIVSVFLWSCKGSAGTATSSQIGGGQSTPTQSSTQGETQSEQTPTENLQKRDTNSDVKYKSGSDVQNTSIKKQYPAAK